MSKDNDELRMYLAANWHKLPLWVQLEICLYVMWKVFLNRFSIKLRRIRSFILQGKIHVPLFSKKV
ncbi:MAG: hypothetical protein C4586_09360 [Anaerolineaceae bacterium]|nr:MAG: hypothetical protein C4586_09360 [Anaerolineaceae bacterium]